MMRRRRHERTAPSDGGGVAVDARALGGEEHAELPPLPRLGLVDLAAEVRPHRRQPDGLEMDVAPQVERRGAQPGRACVDPLA